MGASANPKDSSYDPKKSVVENINLPKNLMTRFDLIWLMLDKRQRDLDRQLANHLVSMYSVSGAKKKPKPPLDAETFRRYVSFARFWVLPRITKEAGDKLIEAYTDLRNQGSSRETITATTRILESLIRLSESLLEEVLAEKGGAGQAVTLDELRAVMNERLASKNEPLMREAEFNQALTRLEEDGRCRRKGGSVWLR